MQNRENSQFKYAEEHFRKKLFIYFLDNLLHDFDSKFDKHLISVYDLDLVLH
jgi:hypothetical protein